MNGADQQIVLLHGLGRSPRSMYKIEHALTRQGYQVLNAGYFGISGNFDQILAKLVDKVESWVDHDKIVHFVGHSFGGILIRGLLAKQHSWSLGRCVMLSTPNQGTLTANYAISHKFLRLFTPLVAQELAVGSQLLANLPEPNIETGIIAGDKPFNPFIPVTWFYKKATDNAPGDGVVEISNTQCRNMSDFIILPLHHSFMMWDSPLIRQIIHFLQQGQFIHLGKK